MDVSKVIAEIDAELERLQRARATLVSLGSTDTVAKPRRGRPKGSTTVAKKAAAPKRKRNLSPEGRKRIADAMKKRWAERRKSDGAKDSSKK